MSLKNDPFYTHLVKTFLNCLDLYNLPCAAKRGNDASYLVASQFKDKRKDNGAALAHQKGGSVWFPKRGKSQSKNMRKEMSGRR